MKALLPLRASWSALVVFGILAAGVMPASGQVIGPKVAGNPDNVSSIFMPAPRALRQQLSRAQAAIAEERYTDAVEALRLHNDVTALTKQLAEAEERWCRLQEEIEGST